MRSVQARRYNLLFVTVSAMYVACVVVVMLIALLPINVVSLIIVLNYDYWTFDEMDNGELSTSHNHTLNTTTLVHRVSKQMNTKYDKRL